MLKMSKEIHLPSNKYTIHTVFNCDDFQTKSSLMPPSHDSGGDLAILTHFLCWTSSPSNWDPSSPPSPPRRWDEQGYYQELTLDLVASANYTHWRPEISIIGISIDTAPYIFWVNTIILIIGSFSVAMLTKWVRVIKLEQIALERSASKSWSWFSSINASVASVHQQHQHISASAASAHQQHQPISSISASAASAR